MARVEVFNEDGSLDSSVNQVIDSVGPFATIPLASRLESGLSSFISQFQGMFNDYVQGGYISYGLDSNGAFRVDLDNYSVTYEGAFSTSGSYVDSVSVFDTRTSRLVSYDGEVYYSGLPLFTRFVGNALYDQFSVTDQGGTAILDVNAIETQSGLLQGHISSWYYNFTAKNGNNIGDLVSGGDIFFTNASGTVDVSSGNFNRASIATFEGGTTNLLNRVTIVDITLPISATSATLDLYAGDDIVELTGKYGSTVYTSSGNDTVVGSTGNDSIYGQAGNDILEGGRGNDLLDGGEGNDVALYALAQTAIEGAKILADGSTEIRTTLGTDILKSIESLQFSDGTLSIDELINENPTPFYETSNGLVEADIYAGPVSFLEYQLVVTEENDVITGPDRNDFINLLGGNDAADGGAGRDVLDGGSGSNFLTGGSGADTFFSDGRGGETTWTTVTDFNDGDNLNIWGWTEGVSKLIAALEGQGADGFKGATFHYDLDGDADIDTSVTFANLK